MSKLKVTHQESRGFKVLQQLTDRKPLPTRQVGMDFGWDRYGEFLSALHTWKPHIFVININDETIQISSKAMSQALQEVLSDMPSEAGSGKQQRNKM